MCSGMYIYWINVLACHSDGPLASPTMVSVANRISLHITNFEPDCDVEMPEPDGTRPFYRSFLALLALSKVQSEIYMRLYSASASRQTEEERERAIKDLDAGLRVWWSEWSQIFSEPRNSVADSFEHIELRFSYHNSMTLVHRMARPGMPSYGWSDEQCLENSRAAIRMINGVVAEGSEVASSGMLLWYFSLSPRHPH